MRAELLTVGTELLSGATVNTNAAYLARRLAELGLPCQRQVVVGDARDPLIEAIRQALDRCDVLVMTGGLGPTFDDVTLEALAEATARPLVSSPTVAARIRRFYRQHRRSLQRAALRQAHLPRGAAPLTNPIGTAPGIWLPLPRPLIIALPGVPREMQAIMERSVLPRLKRLTTGRVTETRTLRTIDVVELSIEGILRTMRMPDIVEVGLYPHLRTVDVRLTASARSRRQVRRALERLEAALRRRLGRAVYGMGEERLEQVVGGLLVRRRQTLAIAESCTGGLVSDLITDVPGSSRYFRGAVIAYHDTVKLTSLGVCASTLARFGAVSAQTAKEMARGIREHAAASVGVAITGIAGPAGGSRRKPVGLVYVGLAVDSEMRARRYQFFGDRAAIKHQAAQAALDWLRRYLLKNYV